MICRPVFLAAATALLVLSSAGGSIAQTDVVRIEAPQVDGMLLDWCKRVGRDCGQPAADAFCRAEGHRRSARFVQLIDPGKPTKTIGSAETCDGLICDSFGWIECRLR